MILKENEVNVEKIDSESTSQSEMETSIEGATKEDKVVFQYPQGERYSGDFNFPKKWKANLKKKPLKAGQYSNTIYIDADNLLKLRYAPHKVREHSDDPVYTEYKGMHRSILNFATTITQGQKVSIKTKGVMIKVSLISKSDCSCLEYVQSAEKLFPHSYKITTNCPKVSSHYNAPSSEIKED